MKKLIMFAMLLAIGAPALATIEDVSPPLWGGLTPRCTYVWQIDTEYGVPSCINFDPLVEDPIFFFGGEKDPCNPTVAIPVGTWTPDPCNGTLKFRNTVAVYVEAPEGLGSRLTIRVQAAFEGGAGFWSFAQIYAWDEENGPISPRGEISGEFEEFEVEGEGTGVWVMEATFYPDDPKMEGEGMPPPDEKAIIGFVCELEPGEGPYTMTGMIIDVLRHNGPAPTTGPGRVICDPTEPLPVIVDPNVMVVYENTDRVTRGDFDVQLARPPFSGNVTVVVDPNGGNGGWGSGQDEDKDIELLAGIAPDNKVTLTFDAGNWNVPQTIVFDALDDTAPEPPELLEGTAITLTLSHPTDPNFVGERTVVVMVEDNDQANILLTITPREKSNPKDPILLEESIQLWEQKRLNFYTQWRKIGVTLQVEPSGGPVEIIMFRDLIDAINPNLPVTDPVLEQNGPDPNRLYFDDTDWNVSQPIKIWGNDDAKRQIDGAEFDGNQNYPATVTFLVIDSGGDERYGKMVEDMDPDTGFGYDPPQYSWEGLVKTVDIKIEDNECGAFGILPGDVSNPNYVTDPNWKRDDPDCYVDIYDVIETARQWLNCSDPENLEPEGPCTSYIGLY